MFEYLAEDGLKLLLSLIVGGLIGLEREYSSKAAGFRTITLISIGSTLFTIISIQLGGTTNSDRIAANIITGIGFIGAGVVFRDGLSVTGITTAASIWVTAALGMTIGSGNYKIAAEGLFLVIIVLSLFEYVQGWIDKLHQVRSYRIVVKSNTTLSAEIESMLNTMRLKFSKKKEMKEEEDLVYYYDVSVAKEKIDNFNSFLMELSSVKSFEW